MNRPTKFMTGLGLGAGLMYFLDPERGGRRRAYLRDQITHLGHQAGCAADVSSRDLAHRVKGLLSELRSFWMDPKETSDEVVVARVRSKLGRVVSHPHAIEVAVHDGKVTLKGLVLVHELDRLNSCVSHVRGVKEIDNQLECHTQDEEIPSLQGGKPRLGQRIDILQTNWSPATRLIVGGVGIAAVLATLRRRDPVGRASKALGLLAALRSTTNLEIKRLLGWGEKRAIDVHKTINISAPVEEVYRFWTDFQNLPKFIYGVKEVKLTGDRSSHWVVQGPAGAPIQWDAVLTEQTPNKTLAWKSVAGSIFSNAGRVRFVQNEGKATKVEVDFSYTPPVGALGHYFAKLLRSSPKAKLDSALLQMKTLIEQGKVAEQGRPASPEEARAV